MATPPEPSNMGKILLIISHPDDESMFFLPSIVAFQQLGCIIHILCLSTGNADGLGHLRVQELIGACKTLDIHSACVSIIDDRSLVDGMNVHWPPNVVAGHVRAAITSLKPSKVVTFDDGGISGHPNHIGTHHGVVQACNEVFPTIPIQLYTLETTNTVRKYIGVFDIIWSLLVTKLRPKDCCCFIGAGPLVAWRALKAHKSQFVWFRRLFILFSRYSYVNTLMEHTLAGPLASKKSL